MKNIYVPIEVSARHMHVTQELVDKLFGNNYQIKPEKMLSQPGQFAAKETVEVLGPKNSLMVRIIGPVRKQNQLEISITDSYFLGIEKPKIRNSGDLINTTGGVWLKGPKGKVNIENGVIIADRHLHIEPKMACKYGLKNGDFVDIQVDTDRPLIFQKVLVRSNENIDKLSFQIDTDEANAADISKKTKGKIIKIYNE